MTAELVDLLLATRALEIAPPDQPFWYTSGTIGPFYLNTHYLYGSRAKAEALLAFIDQQQTDRRVLMQGVLAAVEENYASDAGYRMVIDSLVRLIEREIGAARIAAVSGGERRDWFFSVMAARRLGKPILLIRKDQTVWRVNHERVNQEVEEVSELQGAAVLHVADLVTEASSYVHTWLPALQQRHGNLTWALNLVDRGQGGAEVLRAHGIQPFHLIAIGPEFFESLQQRGYLTAAAVAMLQAYHHDPRASMRRLLLERPEILTRALASPDAKIRRRAELLVAQNVYDLPAALLNACRAAAASKPPGDL
ncbi:MAG: orotate phosphoribosyltransferase [candidate division KSB1 bacterium]|nr:orotate phosphoribosyltransferase [candidate division KSB1 bacterium]MDZ7275934.1 orotate phosphoribosyltransferase [candidate division KSB1 bacterium]MDZ7285784.1 orotate phosphoribosyltransferase [candidate division KSB1 bacterium]MDZ7298816.1 orotate phosphoribosyltransferase [candidate division KSB1 bacterium]MDZ7309442.1 orotate phosphoribosyltransferase [candidate division KSB1 bacterium]